MAEQESLALHATDISVYLDAQAVRYGEEITDIDNAVGDLINDYVINLAKAGDPNGEGHPIWPLYEAPGGILLDFGRDGTAVAGIDPWGAEIDAAPEVGFPDSSQPYAKGQLAKVRSVRTSNPHLGVRDMLFEGAVLERDPN